MSAVYVFHSFSVTWWSGASARAFNYNLTENKFHNQQKIPSDFR